MREGDLEIRAAMTSWFIDALVAAGQSFVLLTGTLQDRLDVAIRTIGQLLAIRMRFAAPLTVRSWYCCRERSATSALAQFITIKRDISGVRGGT